MRDSLFALPLILLLSTAQAAEPATEHGSLGKHEHGNANINIALDGTLLEIALESPTMNIVGFEHAASSVEDKARVASIHTILKQPLALFDLPAAAECSVQTAEVESTLFAQEPSAAAQHSADGDAHSDIDANYTLNCTQPAALTTVSLAPLFKQFPDTHKIAVQLIGPNGQQGTELTPEEPVIHF